uniref:ATP synthase complex subunit 8 n=1 Tax=Anthocharis scolymus TaxID=227537 RepID=A0A894K8Y3_ANTSO|nr:ATP synthase F0 subunit 8 [Anthocharis scolymus]QRW37676.1 ATP synthase F0 subunit 8 [Anthocharis scolymus]UOU95610.1 ATP synthase F0 subunit 8 [Anthocharis scolymus]
MPQMMPINWIFYFLFFLMIFLMFNIMNYYIYFNFSLKSNLLKKINQKKNFYWKW